MGVPDLYAGTEAKRWTAPPPGIDNLRMSAACSVVIPGVGEFEAGLRGRVRMARSAPTSREWAEAVVYLNILELDLRGTSEDLGRLRMRLNTAYLSAGLIRSPFDPYAGEGPSAKACRLSVGAVFDAPKLGLALFNKEPLVLTIDDVRTIPPLHECGRGQIYRMLPLYDSRSPESEPVAYLTRVRFALEDYAEEGELS